MINSNTELIYVLGTKAQFIKSKYILKNLIENNCKIYILDTGQHKEITSKELDFLKNFELITLSKNKKNISTISSMIFWFLKILVTNNKIDEISRAQYCLVHGDTISTLIGLISTVAISFMIKDLINLDTLSSLLLGFMIGILSFLGDMFESFVKRKTGIKDSGKLIPGHGGLMDRFDGYILVLPFFYILSYFVLLS